MKKLKFDEFKLSKELLKAIADLGYEEATPIQSDSIPLILEGKDIIGQSQTGTGKTAAFEIPAIELIDKTVKGVQVLVLCPTRELALQSADELKKLVKYKKNINFLAVYGGQSMERQLNALQRGVDIVIGTPGRVIDHINRRTLKLNNLKMVILDEADEMLNMGFREDIELILEGVPEERQTVMFSATMSKPIMELTKRYLKDPVHVKVVHEVLTVANTEQIYFEIKQKNKLEALTRIIDLNGFKLSLVFCNTKKGVDELVEQLQARGYSADGLHGDMRQQSRERTLNKFRTGNVEILVATDVAARGLDVYNVEAVFNYDMPQDEEYYVHRIGRTGRAGKEGKAYTFVTGWDIHQLRDIQKYIKTKIKLGTIPTYDDIEDKRISSFITQIKNTIEKGNLEKYIKMIEKIADEDLTSLEISAALLKMQLPEDNLNKKDIFEGGSSFEDDDDRRRKSRDRDRKSSRRNDDGDRPKRTKSDRKPLTGKLARLFISAGTKDRVTKGDILGAITGETGIAGENIGNIEMYDKFTFVEVPDNLADQIISVMDGNHIKKKTIGVEKAKAKTNSGDEKRSSERNDRRSGDRNKRR